MTLEKKVTGLSTLAIIIGICISMVASEQGTDGNLGMILIGGGFVTFIVGRFL